MKRFVAPALLFSRMADLVTLDIGQTPAETLYTENKVRLLQYESATDGRHDTPILLVYAVINRPYILDLQSERSVVRQFIERGFDVYLLDWGEPTRLDTALGFEDYVERYLAHAVDVVRNQSGRASIHLFGYCTGGTLATIFAALHPDVIRTLGLLAPILSFETDEGILKTWGREWHVEPEMVSETFGNAPGELLATEFSKQDPVEFYLARYLRLAEHLDDREYVERALRRLRWGQETVDVPGRLYGEFLRDLYREDRLMANDLIVGGKHVDLDQLRMPILDILGTEDRFIPAAASLPFMDTVPSPDTTVIEFPTDHIGLSVGEHAHAELWPTICDWYGER